MQTLKNWTLDHENPDGITLSVEDRHLLHIYANPVAAKQQIKQS